MTGTGIPFIAPLFQQAGWAIPILLFVFFGIVATFCSLFIIEAMQAIPGNRYFQGTVEFGTLINFYFGPASHVAGQIFLYGALESSAIQAIILSAQTFDNIIIDIFKRSCGVSFGPDSGWFCVSELSSGSPYGNEWMLCTGGLILVAILCVPMGLVDLDSNVWLQIVSFAIMVLVFIQWVVSGALAGSNGSVPAIGAGFQSVVGVIMLNFAFTTIVPSWVNIKMKDVNTQGTLWYSVSIGLVFYLVIGIIPGLAFNIPNGSNLLQVLTTQGVPQTLSKATTYIFSIVALVTSIPVFFIVARDNLVQNRVLGRSSATFVAFVLPWIVAIPFQSGSSLTYFVNWSSLIFTSVANFIIPLVIYLRCLKFRRGYNENRVLTGHQKSLLKAIHFASNTIQRGIDDGSIDPNYDGLPPVTPDTPLPFCFVVEDTTSDEDTTTTTRTTGVRRLPKLKTVMETPNIAAVGTTTGSEDSRRGTTRVSSTSSPQTSFTGLRVSLGDEELQEQLQQQEQDGIIIVEDTTDSDAFPTTSTTTTTLHTRITGTTLLVDAEPLPQRGRGSILRGLQTIMRPSAAERDIPFVSTGTESSTVSGTDDDAALKRILRDDVPDPDRDDEVRRGVTNRLLSRVKPTGGSVAWRNGDERSKASYKNNALMVPPSNNSLPFVTNIIPNNNTNLPFVTNIIPSRNHSLPFVTNITPTPASHNRHLPFVTNVPLSSIYNQQQIPEDTEENHAMRSRLSSLIPRRMRGETVELSTISESETLINNTNNNNDNTTLSSPASNHTITSIHSNNSITTRPTHNNRKIQFSSPTSPTDSSSTGQGFNELASRKITQLTDAGFVTNTAFRALPSWLPVRGGTLATVFLFVTTVVTVLNLVFNILQAAGLAQ
ncbi:hypothetical protein SmJEL517_g02723 [Synchytrium microbalum]|uniref:Amino acid transporter transmembrane domain-containing protein n=1 Tax=Synchytrium microbalum TaxID=1806994 RepID=A0A507CAV9_9FUNG|nr:uncharacterized protein SmJEL517_g02723 [Synchytrium microbalum]TPX34663.1 hypothetical protein SmJEL517_g02723 [Synchytrium microbalum]